jgi:hypothetical protein
VSQPTRDQIDAAPPPDGALCYCSAGSAPPRYARPAEGQREPCDDCGLRSLYAIAPRAAPEPRARAFEPRGPLLEIDRERVAHWLRVLAEAATSAAVRADAAALVASPPAEEDSALCERYQQARETRIAPLTLPARKRYEALPEALRLAWLYAAGEVGPPPTFLGSGYGRSAGGLAWPPGGPCWRADQRWAAEQEGPP